LLRNNHTESLGNGLVFFFFFYQRKRDTTFGTWNVRSLYRAGSFTAAARELARYKLDLVGVQEVRWDRESTVTAGDYNFLYGTGNENHQLGTGLLVHHRIISAVTRVEFLGIG
jgi:exonuclease III